MEIEFWHSNILPNSFIRSSLEKTDNGILFKNIDFDKIDNTKLNFLVFLLETDWTYPENKDMIQTHSIEFIELLIKLQFKNFYFIADNSGESELLPDKLCLFFFNLLIENKIDLSRLIILNNDSSKIGINKTKYGDFILKTYFFPNFFLSTHNNLEKYINKFDNNKTIPDKKFLCLNRRMSDEKYKIIEELYNRELLNDTRFTWGTNHTNKNILNKELINKLNIDVDNFKPIQLEDDLIYGSDLVMEKYLYTINPIWYYKSKVNIITETTLYKNSIHLTEKTWKAIYLGIPFVIYAPSKYYLKTLRDMGFKTFNSVINEDYDEMVSGKNKIKQTINSAEELVKIWNTPQVIDICRFNQQLYFNSNNRKQICKELFLDRLNSIQNLIIHKTLI